MSKHSSIPILLACDGGYAPQLATCLRSLVESNAGSGPIDIHVLVEDFPGWLRQRVVRSLPAEAASIRWIEVDGSRFASLTTMAHISRMTFARLLIPDVMPADTPRVLYLDADILVLGDLSALYPSDLGDCPIGAVADPLDVGMRANPAAYPGVPRVQSYFNAGVLLIDLRRWRDERISEKALDYLRRFPSTPYSDQDALNAACDGRWQALDTRWNYHGHLSTRIADLSEPQRPAVVHFVTPAKPWKPSSISFNAPFYDSFRRRTLFARTGADKARDAVATCWYRLRRFARHRVSAST